MKVQQTPDSITIDVTRGQGSLGSQLGCLFLVVLPACIWGFYSAMSGHLWGLAVVVLCVAVAVSVWRTISGLEIYVIERNPPQLTYTKRSLSRKLNLTNSVSEIRQLIVDIGTFPRVLVQFQPAVLAGPTGLAVKEKSSAAATIDIDSRLKSHARFAGGARVILFTGLYADSTRLADAACEMLGLKPWILAMLSNFGVPGGPARGFADLQNELNGVAETSWFFDSATRSVTRQPLQGLTVEYDAEQIAGFRVECVEEGIKANDIEGTPCYRYTYLLSLRLKSGQAFPLRDWSSDEQRPMSLNRPQQEAEETAAFLRNFLGLGPQAG